MFTRCQRLAIAFLCACYGSVTAAAPPAVQQKLEQAVKQARSGQLQPAIRSLEKLYEQYPRSNKIAHDLLVIYQWAGLNNKAAELVPGISFDSAPDYSLEAAARVMRATRQSSEAIRLYRMLLKRQPESKQAVLGMALTHTDAGDFEQARQLLNAHALTMGQDIDFMAATAYLDRLSGHVLKALRLYQSILSRKPDHAEAIRSVYQCAAALGAFSAAKQVVEEHPELFTEQEKKRMAQGLAATHIRWGETPALDQALRYRDIDRALGLLDQANGGDDWSELKPNELTNPGAAYDALVALQSRKRSEETIELFKALLEGGRTIPDYALQSVAAAYLDEQETDQSLTLFQEIKERLADSFAVDHGLFYSLSDSERYRSAELVIDALAAREPEFVREFTNREFILNEKKLKADLLAAFVHAYADDLETAQNRVEQVVERAPNNYDIRVDMATLYRWRGWPLRASKELDLALAYLETAESTNARTQLGHALIDRRLSEPTRPLVTALAAQYPEESSVRKLRRRWQAHEDRELFMRWFRGESSGDQFGSSTWQLDTYLYNRRLADGSRFYIHDFQAFAELENNDIRNELLTLGYEWEKERLKLNVELGKGISGSDELVASAAVNWWLDDHWRVAAELQRNSRATPLKAINLDIESNSLDISAGYRWHELQSAGISLNGADFEDGNDRRAAAGFFRRRLVNGSHYKLTGEVGTSLSSNTGANRPYFNPDEDRTLYLQLENEWRVYRRYESSFHHRLYLTLGDYWQKSFGSGAIWTWRYEHDWQWAPRFRVLYGISRGRRLYDGDAEFENVFYGSLDWRF